MATRRRQNRTKIRRRRTIRRKRGGVIFGNRPEPPMNLWEKEETQPLIPNQSPTMAPLPKNASPESSAEIDKYWRSKIDTNRLLNKYGVEHSPLTVDLTSAPAPKIPTSAMYKNAFSGPKYRGKKDAGQISEWVTGFLGTKYDIAPVAPSMNYILGRYLAKESSSAFSAQCIGVGTFYTAAQLTQRTHVEGSTVFISPTVYELAALTSCTAADILRVFIDIMEQFPNVADSLEGWDMPTNSRASQYEISPLKLQFTQDKIDSDFNKLKQKNKYASAAPFSGSTKQMAPQTPTIKTAQSRQPMQSPLQQIMAQPQQSPLPPLPPKSMSKKISDWWKGMGYKNP